MYKVMLVDDEELERRVLSFALRKSGLPVEVIGEAGSGREAVELARRTSPDFIIMDIKMPGIDGIEATRQIKEFSPATEVIILTAYGKFAYSQQAIRAQASDYLLKPFQPQELNEAVKRVLGRLAARQVMPGPVLDLSILEEMVKQGNLEEGKRQLIHLFEVFTAGEPNPSSPTLASFGLRLMIITMQTVLSVGADLTEVQRLESELALDLGTVASLEGLMTWAQGMLEKSLRLRQNVYARDLPLVRKAMDFIEQNFSSDISLNLVAEKVHLSPAYLSRIFSRKTGVSFSEYLTEVRLKQAKQRLSLSNASIDEIAVATGFSSNSYFTAVFKKHAGLTPSEYRVKQKHQ